jgi:hypothetical protein
MPLPLPRACTMPAHAAPHASALGEHRAEVSDSTRFPSARSCFSVARAATEVPVVEALVAACCTERSVVAQERLPEPGVVPHDAAVEQRGHVHRHRPVALVAEAVGGSPRAEEVRVAGAVGHGVVHRRADANAGTGEHRNLDGEDALLRPRPAVLWQRGEQWAEPRGVAGVVAGEVPEVIAADGHG